jgi:hypothetical protein
MTKARDLANLLSQGQGFATQPYVDTKITQLVNGAPGTLDTLKEIADQLAVDESAVAAITTTLAGKANTSSLATVATTGSYTNLINKPTLFSGSYTDLTNKPTISAGNTLVNGLNQVVLGTDGNLTLPGNTSILTSEDSIAVVPDINKSTGIQVDAPGTGTNHVVTVQTNGNNWLFKSDGKIAFPDATQQSSAWTGTVDYSNVTNKPTTTSVYDTQTTSTGYFQLPQGTTAQRSASPVNGMMRINTTLNCLEMYSSYTSAWEIIKSFNSSSPSAIELLLVAGGGTGGIITNVRGSGGGAGGLIYIPTFPIVTTSTYTVTIGGGGASANGTTAANGGNSVLAGASRTLTALGGGSGGYNDNTNNGATGGSGGGQWYPGYTGAAATQPSTTNDGISTYSNTGFGNKGGNSGAAQPYGSGGGGAGAAGNNFDASGGPVGGIGKQYDISGISKYYAGGGGGAGYPPYGGYAGYVGGLGGGGTGSNDAYNTISNADANSGGGGGAGGSGGSGIFILRYPELNSPLASTTGNPSTSIVNGYRIYKWTNSGSFTV